MKKVGVSTIAVWSIFCAFTLCINAAAGVTAPITINSVTLPDPNGTTEDEFGTAVAISGKTLVVGAPDVTYAGNSEQGVAYVFVKSGNSWLRAAELVASDGTASDEFGTAVAIASNGTVVVGAPNKTMGDGEAYVFEAPAGGWKAGGGIISNTSKPLTGASQNFYSFGYSVAISSNGKTVVVGEPQYFFGYNPGTVYVFASPNWGQTAKFNALGGTLGDSFGYSVAISGSTIVAGAPFANLAYAIQLPGLAQSKLGVAGTDEFGRSVAISGNTIVVGVPFSEAAYVFTLANGVWNQAAELTPSDTKSGQFGNSVATIGEAVVVGAPDYSSSANSFTGAAYLFIEPSHGWKNAAGAAAFTGNTPSEFLGVSISVSGETAVTGAWGFNSFEGEAVVLSP